MAQYRHYTKNQMAGAFNQFAGEKIEGRPDQGIFDLATTQNYRIGARYVEPHPFGRTFRYSYAAGDLAGLARLVINSNYAPGVTGHENEDGFEGVLHAEAAIGQTYVDIADTNLRAANFYEGGLFVAFGTNIFHQHYIVSSQAGNGTYVRLWLADPIVIEAIDVADGVTAYRSPYSAVQAAMSVQQEFEPFVGLNLKGLAAGNYFWMMTAGPCIVTAHGGTWPGSAAHLRDVYAWMDGTIDPATVADPSLGYQRVGYLLSATGGTGADYGDMFIMLQLDK
ncbi:MAG: hypothetical protein ACOC58_00095 [Chloroflexota bacterium]